jgi:putative membrane-bound dehydrogenase-like protein
MRSLRRAVLALAFLAHAFAADPSLEPRDLPRSLPIEPAKALATLAMRPGFRPELMAAEPLVVDPIAMCFDEDARLFVVEMCDYPERREEKLGRVKLLEDTDGDGRYDRASVFAKGLPWPSGITCWDGGVFVLAAPDLLYFKDTDGDRTADVRALIFTGFGNLAGKLNVQALPNSLQWGPDQRIHGALGGNASSVQNFARFGEPKIELRGRDFSFDPRQMDLRPESGGGQYGLTFDDTGRRFVCSNSRHLMQVMYEDRVAAKVTDYPLPAPAVDIAADGPQAEVFRRSPDEAWRVIRTQWRVSGAVKGMIEGSGRPSGYFTSASGITIYRGDAWPAEFRGDAFIADPGSNLIHRKKLRGDLLQAGERVPDERHTEFLASTDNWFRPVAFANAPDGTLWFADMYREVIEHPWSLPESLKKHLDLTSGSDRGRLYRVVPEHMPSRPQPRLGKATTVELARLLEHPNGWHRDTAARLLHERRNPEAVAPLAEIVGNSAAPASRLLALHVLGGLDALDAATLGHALRDADSDVRAGAVRLCGIKAQHAELVSAMASDPARRVRFEVACALLTLAPDRRAEPIAKLLEKADTPWLRHAALAAAGDALQPALALLAGRAPALAEELRRALSEDGATVPSLPFPVSATSRREPLEAFRAAVALSGDAEKGRAIYDARCALCHRLGRRGAAVGPDLDAARIGGREKTLGNILEPSRELTAGYPLAVVQTAGGATLSGIAANDVPAGVVLRLPGGIERVVRRSQIARIDRPQRSLMPDGLESGLTPQDMANLLEFLMAPPPKPPDE